MRSLLRIAALVFMVGASVQAFAVNYSLTSDAGLMQQPSSHYYLAVYGATGEMAWRERALFLRGSFVQRPQYRAAGYLDQDSGEFAFIGTKVTKQKDHGLLVMAGWGSMQGYVEVDHNEYP